MHYDCSARLITDDGAADLDKLQQDEVAHICEWLTEKVDSYSTRLNPEPKDEPEEVRCH